MIFTLPLEGVRSFRALLRRLLPRGTRARCPFIYLQAGPGGLALLASIDEVALRWHQPGPKPEGAIGLPGELLDRFEGSGKGELTLELTKAGQARACWQEKSVPRECEVNTVTADGIARLPDLPRKMTPLPVSFLAALAEAGRTASSLPGRAALQRVLVRGSRGQVVGTDGRQLLILGGFELPWKEDLLVPASPVFGSRELRGEGSIGLGRTENWLALQVGPWTFQLATDNTKSYPDVDRVIPSQADTPSKLNLDAEDIEQLKTDLPRLPGRDDDGSPITLELGTKVAVRAREQGQEAITELLLGGSSATGPPVLLAVDRRYLLRALQLGFSQIEAGKAQSPVVCREPDRLYLWMPLGAEDALPPSERALRIASQESRPRRPSKPDQEVDMPNPKHEESPPCNGAPQRADRPISPELLPGLDGLIAEVESMRAALQETQTRLTRLGLALKQQRRQARVVQAAVASLRQL